jgi:regulator of replication initiation timing
VSHEATTQELVDQLAGQIGKLSTSNTWLELQLNAEKTHARSLESNNLALQGEVEKLSSRLVAAEAKVAKLAPKTMPIRRKR